ncbi:MAG TPA: hemolysin family protein [Pyrinomonadaceae bacterium]|jgi:CBS domain containing-hemolysin-like protein
MYIVLNIVAVLLLVLANGFFVAAEFALVSVRRSRIETMAAEGSGSAKRLMGLLNNMNAYLSAAQLGITLASLALGWIGEPAIAHILEGPLAGRVSDALLHTISFIIAFGIITSLHIVLGEQAPKLLGLERAANVALWTALPMQIFYRIFRPFIWALDWASARTVGLIGLHYTGGHGSIYTEEEIRQLVNSSQQGGMLEESERLLINRVLDFAQAEVREAMIPRMSVIALPVTATLEESEKAFCETGYSRLPVYSERLDNVQGVLFMKDLMQCIRKPSSEFQLEKHLHPPMFIPATARLGGVLAQMQAAQTHLAFVIDEHGGIEGIVTMEDLLEEIVGEINDEYDEEVRAQIVEDNGTYILDGMLAVRDANRRFNLKLPEEAGYTTLAGFMLAQTGRLLRPGEEVEYEGARFTVERVERRRIRRIRFVPAPESEEEAVA